MKNILMYFAIALFILAMTLLAQSSIEYGIIAIVVAIALVLASCLIDKEEECNNLKAQQAATYIRIEQLKQREKELLYVVNNPV